MSHFPAGVHKGSISRDNRAPRAPGRFHGGAIKPWNCTWNSGERGRALLIPGILPRNPASSRAWRRGKGARSFPWLSRECWRRGAGIPLGSCLEFHLSFPSFPVTPEGFPWDSPMVGTKGGGSRGKFQGFCGLDPIFFLWDRDDSWQSGGFGMYPEGFFLKTRTGGGKNKEVQRVRWDAHEISTSPHFPVLPIPTSQPLSHLFPTLHPGPFRASCSLLPSLFAFPTAGPSAFPPRHLLDFSRFSSFSLSFALFQAGEKLPRPG